MLGASLGLHRLFGGIEAKGSFSSTAARLDAIEAADAIATQKGYSDSVEKIMSSAQSFTAGNNNTKGDELGAAAFASLNHTKSLREEASIAQNQLDTISKEISSSQGKSFTVNKDLTQDILSFIAHQPSNPGPNGTSGGQIGYKEARRILENGGEEREAYLKSFQAQNPQYAIQSINVAGHQSTLKAQYETQAQQQRSRSGAQAQHLTNTQGVQHRAQEKGISFEDKPPSSSPVKQNTLAQLKEREDKIKTGLETIKQQEKVLKEAEKASKEKTLGVTAVKNLAKSAGRGAASVLEDMNSLDTPILLP